MNAEEQQLYLDQLSLTREQEQIRNNELIDSSIAAEQQQEIENSRQFYLSYQDELEEMARSWKGQTKKGDKWVTVKKNAIMDDDAADKVISIIKGLLQPVMGKVTRLSNFQFEVVNRMTFELVDQLDSWLMTEGLIRYNINNNYFGLISKECETYIYSSLNWALNAGGRNFMTTSSRTIENVSHVLRPNSSGQPVSVDSGSKNPFKIFSK